MRAFWYSELLTMLPPETSLPLLPRTACDRPVVCRACCIDCLIFLRASIAAAVAAADVNPEASDDTMDSCPLGGVPADISLDGVPTDPPSTPMVRRPSASMARRPKQQSELISGSGPCCRDGMGQLGATKGQDADAVES